MYNRATKRNYTQTIKYYSNARIPQTAYQGIYSISYADILQGTTCHQRLARVHRSGGRTVGKSYRLGFG